MLGEASEFAGHGGMAIVGRDTRASGEFLSATVVGGLAAAGVNVYDAGVWPTPAVAFLTADANADLGVMLTASHNPMPDNGIKFFSRSGHKLSDAVEDAFEARLGEEWQGPTGINVGRVLALQDGRSRYIAHLLGCLPNPFRPGTAVLEMHPGDEGGMRHRAAAADERKGGNQPSQAGGTPAEDRVGFPRHRLHWSWRGSSSLAVPGTDAPGQRRNASDPVSSAWTSGPR